MVIAHTPIRSTANNKDSLTKLQLCILDMNKTKLTFNTSTISNQSEEIFSEI